MNRDDLIRRLVARKMSANARGKAGCVPCLGSPARKICFAATNPPTAANPKR